MMHSRPPFGRIWLFCLSAVSVSATTYYVSSSLPSANDGNAGTDPALPWRTFANVQGPSPSVGLSPGDSVLLLQGDVWVLESTVQFLKVLGTPTQPIYFGSYNLSTSQSMERPALYRNMTAPNTGGHGPVVLFNDSTGIIIEGWELAWGEQAVVFFYHQPGTFSAGIQLLGNYFHDIRGLAYSPSSGNWWGTAVACAAAYSGVTVNNVLIKNNLAQNSDTFYINQLPWNETTRAYVSGINVTGNFMTAMSYNTLFMDTTDTFLVTSNVFLHNEPLELFLFGTTDIIMGTLNASCRLIGNEIGWRGEYPGGPDGCAVDFETTANGVLFAENYVYHSWGSGIMVLGHQTTSTNLLIEKNIMLYNGCNQTAADHGGMVFMHVNSSGNITQNIFATCPGVPLFYDPVPGAMNGFSIYNNTIAGPTTPVTVAQTPTLLCKVNADKNTTLLTASCAESDCIIRYTLDGSRPTAGSYDWQNGTTIVTPPRATAVLAKAFSSSATVESFIAGGIYFPGQC